MADQRRYVTLFAKGKDRRQLLHAVLDARDDDIAHVDMSSDVIEQLEKVTDRLQRSPDLIGLFTVLQSENLAPDAPLHDRFLGRYRDAIEVVTECIRRGQQAGAYRADLDPAVKAVEVITFLHGFMEWRLHGCSIPRSLDSAERRVSRIR